MMGARGKAILIGSLVANLFLAGVLIGVLVIGSQLMHDRDGRGPGGGGGRREGVWSAYQAIPQERREALREMMREPARAAGEDMRAAREARRRAAELIRQASYDAAAVEAALGEARAREDQARAKIDAALAVRLAQLSPDERAVFAEIMTRGRIRAIRRDDGGHGGAPDKGPDGPPPGLPAPPKAP